MGNKILECFYVIMKCVCVCPRACEHACMFVCVCMMGEGYIGG